MDDGAPGLGTSPPGTIARDDRPGNRGSGLVSLGLGLTGGIREAPVNPPRHRQSRLPPFPFQPTQARPRYRTLASSRGIARPASERAYTWAS